MSDEMKRMLDGLPAWQREILERCNDGQDMYAIMPRYPDKTAAIALLRALIELRKEP